MTQQEWEDNTVARFIEANKTQARYIAQQNLSDVAVVYDWPRELRARISAEINRICKR